jgi:hypothetical protein
LSSQPPSDKTLTEPISKTFSSFSTSNFHLPTSILSHQLLQIHQSFSSSSTQTLSPTPINTHQLPENHTMNTTNMLGLAVKHTLVQGIKSQASTTLAGLETCAHGVGEICPREPTIQAGLCVLSIPIIILISTKVYQHLTTRSKITNLPAAEQAPASTECASDKPKARGNRRGGRRGGRGRYKGKNPQTQPQAPPARPAFQNLPEQANVWNHFAVSAPKQYTDDAKQAWQQFRAEQDGTIVKPKAVDNTTLKETYKCTKAPTCEAPPPPPERKPAVPPHLRARAGQSSNISET